jgi:hypothetical protein
MDQEQFWALIETARAATSGDCQAQTTHLVTALGERSVNDVLAWDRIHGELMDASYRLVLWGPPTCSTAAALATASTTSAAGCSAKDTPPGRLRWLTRTR